MAKTGKSKSKKQKLTENTTPRKIEKQPKSKRSEKALATTHPSDSGSDSDSDPDKLQKLLEPYSKDQLISFISDAAASDPFLFKRIRETADRDVSHRKIFVRGLGWDTTRELLLAAFEPYGQIEDCNVVTDRNTGKARGYGFVLFKTRQGAVKALKQPRKKINNRFTQSHLASLGSSLSSQSQDTVGRKIYVGNIHADVDPERLLSFFGKFGEIETGPIGFDMQTGKSRGFALFVYKNQESVRKALEEPYKTFEGHQLHCRLATDVKNKVLPQPQPQLAAEAATQNLILSQHPTLNMVYSGLLANPNPGMIGAAAANPMVAGAMNPGMISSSQVGPIIGSLEGLGGYGTHGVSGFGGAPSVLTPPSLGLQHAYPSTQLQQSSAGRVQGTGAGTFSGYPSYMWYGFPQTVSLHIYVFGCRKLCFCAYLMLVPKSCSKELLILNLCGTSNLISLTDYFRSLVYIIIITLISTSITRS